VIGPEDVREAARRIRGLVHRTPVLASESLNRQVGATAFLKAESFQRTGSFKIRGALAKMSSLQEETLAAGVVAYSSGNHAQAVALSARLSGAPAVILMPEDAPVSKRRATEGYGAEVITFDRYSDDREALGRELAQERGLTLIPPFDDPMVMAGQGTSALELLEEVGRLDVLVCPVGGGGLIAGCATLAKGMNPSIKVFGVEPEAGDDTRRSLELGERVTIPVPRTIADGLQLAAPGRLTFEVNRRLLDGVVTVADEEIVQAMTFLFERVKIVVEPSGAVGVAALLAGRVEVEGHRVGVVLSGGNVDAGRFAQLLSDAPTG
jgi:threo-3-hydroxy-L-aspartate ammonia-lyase